MGFGKTNLSHKKKLGEGGVVEGMEHIIQRLKARRTRRACSCCFFFGVGYSRLLLDFPGHLRRPRWPLSTLEAWRYNFICYFEFRMYWAFHGVSLMAKEIYLLFFFHLFSLSTLLFLFFFSSSFSSFFSSFFFDIFIDFQLFKHEQPIFFPNVP